MLGYVDIEFESAQHNRGGDARYENCGKQRGHDHVEQVIAALQSCDSKRDGEQDVDQPGPGDVIVHRFAKTRRHHTLCQVGHGGKANEGSEQQCRRRQNNRAPDIARLARDSGKKRRGKCQHQTGNRDQKAHPYLGNPNSQRKGC